MNEELWKDATDKSKFEWLRQRAITLQEKCDKLQEKCDKLQGQVDGQRLSSSERRGIRRNVRY